MNTLSTGFSVRQNGCFIFALVFGCCLAWAPFVSAEQRPNIIFIFSDDHALQAIGAYGSQVNQTPQIDRLASEGMVFLNSFCGNSICGPSRASVLTGKHSHLNGYMRNGDRFDGSQMTFPKLMREAGYQTALVGKWHLASDPTGFDHWEILPGQGRYYNPDFIQMDGSTRHYEGYCTDLITDFALDWLDSGRDPARPFVLMVQHKAPHRNWSPDARHFGRYPHGTIPEPETLFDDYADRSRLLQENEMSIRDHFRWMLDMKFHGENLFPEHFVSDSGNLEYERMTPEQAATWDAFYGRENEDFIAKMNRGELSDEDIVRWKYQRYMHDYLGSVEAVDEGIGRILDHLDASGLADNTVVIYSSDQGFYLGEHGWYDKRWMFEESLQMPFIIRWPGVVEAGIRSEAMIQNIDYAPTFLEIGGIGIPAEIQGESLVPILQNAGRAPPGWRDAIYYAYYESAAAHNVAVHDGVRTDRYKAIYFPRTREWNLFDLEADPREMRSFHDDPEYAGVLSALQQRYRDLRGYYQVNSATIAITRRDEQGWRTRNDEKTALARQGGVDLAFIGDSITQQWETRGQQVWDAYYGHRNAINLGFGGDRTEHVLWRLERGNLDGIHPKAAVVMIGTNNTGHLMQEPREIAEGVERILEVLSERLPETKVLLLGIFPRGESPLDPRRLNNLAVNRYIRRLADGERVRYLDIGDVFLEPDGTLSEAVMPDRLHLNEEGYRRWAEAMEPALRDLGL